MTKSTRGFDFLAQVRSAEERCAKETWKTLPKTGKQVPRCLDALGELLSLTYRAATCHWGCAGPDHTVNHLAVRIAATASASIRCLTAGYYDESLALTRSIGELSNLLVLFVRIPGQFEAWRRATRRERLDRFSPFKVRLALESNNIAPPIDQERYSALSESGVHATADMVPGGHNPRRRAVLGHVFQLPGAIVALSELAIATAVAGHQVSRLLKMTPEVCAEFDGTVKAIVDGLPGIDITNVRELLESLGRDD